jgi:hypothetical protein
LAAGRDEVWLATVAIISTKLYDISLNEL